MKRRAFLAATSGIPSMLPGAARTPSSPRRVIFKAAAPVAPRVQLAADQLLAAIRLVSVSAPVKGLQLIVEPKFANEEWEARVAKGEMTVRAADNRGLVYGLAALQRAIESARAIPASLSLRRTPQFRVRRWSAAVSHNFGSPWDERIHLAERFAYIKSEVIPRAADYGMNSLEINGRPDDGWDVGWVVSYEGYPELRRQFPADERLRRLSMVEDVAQAAHEGLLDFLVWSHELYLPDGFTEIYPQVAGTDYPVCLSNDFLKDFIRAKYIEFFRACPSVDGVVLSVNESGQFSLITDAGCHCDRCAHLTQHGRLMAVLDPVIDVARQFKRQVILRTFQSAWKHDLYGHPELETIRKAYTGVPSYVQIMSKYCPLDFYGGAIADEPLIGAFPNPHLVEFSLDVEWQGRTFVPALTAENFRRRIAHAARKKCAGAVARVDFPFPSMEPGAIFGHPNEFNAWYLGELLWDTETDIDDSLRRWTTSRYGEAASALAPALRKTEAITQQTFFCLGQTLISYHNMIAGVSFADNFLWSQALSKWDISKRTLSESFFAPGDALIGDALREKAAAARLSAEAAEQVRAASGKLPDEDYERLRCWFEKLTDSAGLWGSLTELYLRHRQLASSPSDPARVQSAILEPERLNTLIEAARASLLKSIAMERIHGSNSWPVNSPDRGVSVYEFVQQVLRNYISALTGEPMRTTIRWDLGDTVVTEPIVDAGSIEGLWRGLVEMGRPGALVGRTTETRLAWPKNLSRIRLAGASMTLEAHENRTLALPLAFPVRNIVITGAGAVHIGKHVGELIVALRNPA